MTRSRHRESTKPQKHETETRRPIPALHGVRFIAVSCILLGHGVGWIMPATDNAFMNTWLAALTSYGMPLFFVLSGFVIYYNYSGMFCQYRLKWATASFLGARIARLYPLFICCVLLGFSIQEIFLWLDDYKFEFAILAVHDLTLTQSWFAVALFKKLLLEDGFGIGWSISTEFFFYIVYIFIAFTLVRLRTIRATLIASLFFVAAVHVFLYASLRNLPAIDVFAARHLNMIDMPAESSFTRWLFYYSPYVRIFEFILGCLAAHLFMLIGSARMKQYVRGVQVALLASLLLTALLYILSAAGGERLSGYMKFYLWNFGYATPFCGPDFPERSL